MIIRSIAPLRISFAGGGTDILEYYREHGGAVINSTINWYAHTNLTPAKAGVRVISLDYGSDEEIKHFDYTGKNDLIKATLNKMIGAKKEQLGAEFFMHTDTPPGSGLGASSAVVVSLVGAINKWTNKTMNNYEIAELAYDIERNELCIRGGYQDQYAATFGGFNHIEFLKDGKVIVNPLRVSDDTVHELEAHLLLCYTGTTRQSSGIIENQIKGIKEGSNLDMLHKQKEMAFDMKNVLLRGNLDRFGEMLDEAWQTKKKLTSNITNQQIDKLYDAARKSGAIGGKILGAGGGGYLLLYCNYKKKHLVEKMMNSLGAMSKPFSFSKEGLTVWESKNEY